MSVEIRSLEDNLYDLYNPLIQDKSVQEMVLDIDLVTGNKINGKIDGAEIAEIDFTTDHATTMGLLAAELETFSSIDTATVNDKTITITARTQGYDFTLADFIVTGGATQPDITITETRTEKDTIWSNQDGEQPTPPYMTMNIISGPRNVGDDDFIDSDGNGNFEQRGLRQITLSLQAYGEKSFELLSRVQTLVQLPEIVQKFKAVKYSVSNLPPIVNISNLVEVNWESRHQMDILMYIPSTIEAPTTYIETVTYNNQLAPE